MLTSCGSFDFVSEARLLLSHSLFRTCKQRLSSMIHRRREQVLQEANELMDYITGL